MNQDSTHSSLTAKQVFTKTKIGDKTLYCYKSYHYKAPLIILQNTLTSHSQVQVFSSKQLQKTSKYFQVIIKHMRSDKKNDLLSQLASPHGVNLK